MGNSRFLKVSELRVQYIGDQYSACRLTERLVAMSLGTKTPYSIFCKGLRTSLLLLKLKSVVGPGTEDGDAASVRADHCVPIASGIYYFEIEVRVMYFRLPCSSKLSEACPCKLLVSDDGR